MNQDIKAYNSVFSKGDKKVCDLLAKEIDAGLPKAESKVWHRTAVWFLDRNPVVGYSKRKNSVQLLFWSGQSFEEKGLEREGSFKAAQIHYTDVKQINSKDLKRWLKKAQTIQWDYKNIVKRKGKLVRLKPTVDRKAANINRVYTMSFAGVYPHYITKAEKKGRTKVEVDEIIRWLTGYTQKKFEAQLKKGTDMKHFFAEAPKLNPARKLITGVVCGVRLEEIKDPLMREVRYLDKLIDELAKGRPMEKILRT